MANKTDTIAINSFDDTFNDFSITLQESIKNVIKKEGYIKYKVTTNKVPQLGNFLSSLCEVDIIGRTTDEEKITSLFIKESITLEKATLTNVSEVYSRELYVYNEISRAFSSLQDAANVPDKERFRFSKSYSNDNKTVIMENMSKKGFKTHNGTQTVEKNFAELSIKELAKFHALSYVLKHKTPKYFDSKIKILKHTFNLNSDWDGFINNVCTVTAEVVKGEAGAKIKKNIPRMLQTYKKFIKDTVPSNGCLCHGDYKILNILVKELDGEASEVRLIDYQLAYYGNPLDDFLFFIFSGTDREFRRKHLRYMKDLYFENFAKFLRYFKLDVNSVYSRQEFENDYEERLELGLVTGLYISAYTFAHLDEGFDLNKRYLSELTIIPDELFADRVRGIVDDYIEWGYL